MGLYKPQISVLIVSDLADGIVKLCDCETKGYDYDENGQSLGAAWYNEWITANGKVVRKSEPVQLRN